MKVTNVEKLDKSQIRLTIASSAEEFETAIQKVYIKNRGKFQMRGFRKGKAPRKLIEQMYGSNIFYENAVNEAYPALLEKAVEEEKLDMIGYSELELVEAKPEGFTFKATVSIRPEVKLGAYKGLSAPKEKVEPVTEQDVDAEMEHLVARAARLVNVERAAERGDTVTIDYEGFIDGVAFEGGKGENFDLELGSGTSIPGFEDQLIGTTAGEEKELKATFPEDYDAQELAGQEALFRVKVHSVKVKENPVLDDEFAKDVSEFETLAELRDDLRQKITVSREEKAQQVFEDALLEKLVSTMECDVPDAMVERRIDRLVNDYAQRVANQGLPFDQYLAMTGMTVDVLREQAAEGALQQVKLDLALKAVAKAEHLEVTQEDIDEAIEELSKQYNMPDKQVRKTVPMEDLRSDILNQKAAAVIFDSATVEAAPAKEPENGGPEAEPGTTKKKTTRGRKKKEDNEA